MKTLQRYIRAFLLAFRMTLRGEKIPERVQHPLVDWARQLDALVDEIYRAADSSGLNKETRQTLKIRIDSRPMSVETILATLQFHARQEYPSLLRHKLTNEVTNTLYATNLNDHFWVMRLREADALQQPLLQAALGRLEAHLQDIPRS